MFTYVSSQQIFIEDQLHAQAMLAPGVAGRPMGIDALHETDHRGVSGFVVIRFALGLHAIVASSGKEKDTKVPGVAPNI